MFTRGSFPVTYICPLFTGQLSLTRARYTEYNADRDEVMVFKHRVEEAARAARTEMKNEMEEQGKKGSKWKGAKGGNKGIGHKRRRDNMDTEEG